MNLWPMAYESMIYEPFYLYINNTMTRKHTSEIRLYCIKCKDFTQSTGPIIINKLATNRLNIKVLWSIRNKLKFKFLTIEQIKL